MTQKVQGSACVAKEGLLAVQIPGAAEGWEQEAVSGPTWLEPQLKGSIDLVVTPLPPRSLDTVTAPKDHSKQILMS